jgi:zinc ribbon protein
VTTIPTGLIVGIILVAALIVGAFYALRQLRGRRERLKDAREKDPRLQSDRAFNRLAMARTEADLLARQGVDVTRARELIRLSEQQFGTRQFDRSYELAQSAHESLVAARRGVMAPPVPSPEPGPAPPARVPGGAGLPPDPGLDANASPTRPSAASANEPPRLPKNQVEAQFELRLLEKDLEVARKDPSRKAATKKADATRAEAQLAFDKADYRQAFSLALRGRREAGGKVETLAPEPGRKLSPASDSSAGPAATNPVEEAARAASSERCLQCGYPMLTSDTFCRGCGKPRGPSPCPKCGAPRVSGDSFCGKCGSKLE